MAGILGRLKKLDETIDEMVVVGKKDVEAKEKASVSGVVARVREASAKAKADRAKGKK